MAKTKIKMRTPSVKRSVSARTTGRISRSAKKAVNPFYGKKGMGYIKDPEKAIKNSLYHKTTTGISDLGKSSKSGSSTVDFNFPSSGYIKEDVQLDPERPKLEPAKITKVACLIFSLFCLFAMIKVEPRGNIFVTLLFLALAIIFMLPVIRKRK